MRNFEELEAREVIAGAVYTPKEVCTLWQVGKNNLLRMLKSGDLDGAFRVGNLWRVPGSALLDFAERNKAQAKEQR